jgi:transposase
MSRKKPEVYPSDLSDEQWELVAPALRAAVVYWQIYLAMSYAFAMKLHANAALTISQRKQVKGLATRGEHSQAQLARRFGVHPNTISRWAKRESPLDHKAPIRAKRVVTPQYEQAVIAYRIANPHHGAIRIALALQDEFAFAHRGTVALILKRHGLTRKRTPRPKPAWKIPVGKHRLQMDIQQLPAVQGGHDFEYKISLIHLKLIHLKTRWKYSEIHDDCTSVTVAAVYQRALDNLPPFS